MKDMIDEYDEKNDSSLEILDIDKSLVGDINNIIDKSSKINQIATRAADPNEDSLMKLHTVNEEMLTYISENMVEQNRAANVWGRQNSQVTDKLMSLTMIASNPYHVLKQCAAKIERKRTAVKETNFKLKRSRIKLERAKDKRSRLLNNDDYDKYEVALLDIKIEEIASSIADTMLYYEGALKEIAVYQSAYNQVKKNHNIPDDYDEEDFLKGEIKHHLREAFNHGIRDVMSHGSLGMGTLEYLEQYGVNPHTALVLIKQYLSDNETMIADGKYPTVSRLYKFLDEASELFKDAHNEVLNEIGLDALIETDFIYKKISPEESSGDTDDKAKS